MKSLFFVFGSGSVELRSISANITVSTNFNKWEINEEITQKLSEINFKPDLDSLNYRIRENQLFVEDIAYELQEPPHLTFDII